ncbi:MAG: AAA family ATPase [Candidatus Altiarchaeota archaeon]
MDRSILVTGVPGSGKSEVCEELKRLGHNAFDIDLIPEMRLVVDKSTGRISAAYDNRNLASVKQRSFLCDKTRLHDFINRNGRSMVFYCGNASNIDELLSLFDATLLLKASESVLLERLKTRTSNNFARSPEIQEWILGWKKSWEDRLIEKGAVAVDADRSIHEVASDVVEKGRSPG